MEGLSYHPVLADAVTCLDNISVSQFLLIGPTLRHQPGLPRGFDSVGEGRMIDSVNAPLPTGTYKFSQPQGWRVMLVTEGTPPSPPQKSSRGDARAESLERAEGWFEHLWDTAQVLSPPMFSNGDIVAVGPDRAEGTVKGTPTFGEGTWMYAVRCEGRTRHCTEDDLNNIDIDDDPIEWISRSAENYRAIAATLTRSKLQEHLTDTVYSFGASRTEFRPYQFRPVIKLLRTDHHRLLIADEVGLGKTIEAGLIWTELEARRQADRVLVVCPAMLESKWVGEMRERFGFDLSILDSTRLSKLLEQLEFGRFPTRFHAVCSLERLRRREDLERFNDLAPRFDLVIVDEAHWFRNLGTKSHALGALLTEWAEALLFLSATPLNLGNDDLFNLLQLLDPGEFDDRHALEMMLRPNAVLNRVSAALLDRDDTSERRIARLREIEQVSVGSILRQRPEYKQLINVLSKNALHHDDVAEARRLIADLNTLSAIVTRTRKSEVIEEQAMRVPHQINVILDPAEKTLYNAVYDWQIARAKQLKAPFGFVGQMPLRLAGSCLQAMKIRLKANEANRLDDDWDLDSDYIVTLDNPNTERPPKEVIDAADALGDQDTKYEEFISKLHPIVEQGKRVLVFTFSRYTLAYLHERLQESFKICVLHGDVPSRDRVGLIEEFRAGQYEVMVATRVASEGLDFEFCSAVVNYDLPWNPMEVEQRIGRIDRFGQQEERINILNFTTPGTIESDIISRVHERIGVFTSSIGELEPILHAELPELRQVMFDFTLSNKERQLRLDKILTAVANNARLRAELEEAADFLNVVDIDQFDSEVIDAGRYVGQHELVWLLEDWANTSPGTSCATSNDSIWLNFRGDNTLADALDRVEAAGERSRSELDQYRIDLRDEQEIRLCLDQKKARMGGHDLLNANHPLVRAALRGSVTATCRFGSAQIIDNNLEPGDYLVLVAIAHWDGVRSSKKLWTAAVASTNELVGDSIGDALLASLANGSMKPLSRPSMWTEVAVLACQGRLEHKLLHEKARYEEENKNLAESRSISIHESYHRKIANNERRIETLNANQNLEMIPLFESQIRHLHYRLDRQLEEIDLKSSGTVNYEYLALCDLEISNNA